MTSAGPDLDAEDPIRGIWGRCQNESEANNRSITNGRTPVSFGNELARITHHHREHILGVHVFA